jgi:transposase-like protein
MKMNHKLSEEEKIYILQNIDKKSLGLIAEQLNINKQTAFKFKKKWARDKSIIN